MLLLLVLALQLALGPVLQRLVSRFIKAAFDPAKPSLSVLVGPVLLVAAAVGTIAADIKVLVDLGVPAAVAFNSAAVHTQPHPAVAVPCRLSRRLFRLLPTHGARPMLLNGVMIRPVIAKVSAKAS